MINVYFKMENRFQLVYFWCNTFAIQKFWFPMVNFLYGESSPSLSLRINEEVTSLFFTVVRAEIESIFFRACVSSVFHVVTVSSV